MELGGLQVVGQVGDFADSAAKEAGTKRNVAEEEGVSGDQYVLLLAVTDEFNEADVAVAADLYAGKSAGGVFMHDVPVKPVVAVAAGKSVVCFIVTQDAGVLLPVFLCFDFGFFGHAFVKGTVHDKEAGFVRLTLELAGQVFVEPEHED